MADRPATGSRAAKCWDCGHGVEEHSKEYAGWDRRLPGFNPKKQPGTGCLVPMCGCRRWFEVGR